MYVCVLLLFPDRTGESSCSSLCCLSYLLLYVWLFGSIVTIFLLFADNRTHFCTFMTCTKAFKTADSLKVHMLFHQDLKPLKCEHCEYTCRQKASIRFHMKKKHPELVKNDLVSPKSSAKPNSNDKLTPKGHSDKSVSIKHEAESVEADDTVKASEDLDTTGQFSDSESSFHEKQTPLNSPLQQKPKPKPKAIRTTDDNDPATVCLKSDAPSKTAVTTNQNSSDLLNPSNENSIPPTPSSSNEIATKKSSTNEIPSKKPKKTDMYDFQSEDESGDDMKPGWYRMI